MTTKLAPEVRPTVAKFLRLSSLLRDADPIQWQPSRKNVPRDDTTERASGIVSDPTATTALDPGRLRLRAEMDATIGLLLVADAYLDEALQRLETALETRLT